MSLKPDNTGLTKLNSKLFTFVRDASGLGGEFVIERSELDHAGGALAPVREPRAVAFVVVSSRTGIEGQYRLTHTEFKNGEPVFWIFSPTFSSYNQAGARDMQYTTVKVLNT